MPKNKSSYFKRVNHFYDQLSIVPAPNRVLIRVTKKQIEDLISKEIVKEDGTTARLFFEPIHFDQGYDRKFQQNVSVGECVGVGVNVHGIKIGDIVILDYLASNLSDECIGFVKGDQMISMIAHTTYHQSSSVLINGRRAWAKGDYDHISRILGVVRGDKLIPFDPYVFVEYESDLLHILNDIGERFRSTAAVISRTVLSSPEGSIFKCGQKVFMKRDDWFDREIDGRKIAICFKQDIMCGINGYFFGK